MDILDVSKKPYIADEDKNVFIGLKLPIQKSIGIEGYFSSTTTTIDAVKTNIVNLLQTNQGERIMQPTLGLNLREYLFEPFTDDLELQIQNEISENLGFWLPFVNIVELNVNIDSEYDIGTNKILIDITFSISRDPNTLSSIQVEISGNMLAEGDF